MMKMNGQGMVCATYNFLQVLFLINSTVIPYFALICLLLKLEVEMISARITVEPCLPLYGICVNVIQLNQRLCYLINSPSLNLQSLKVVYNNVNLLTTLFHPSYGLALQHSKLFLCC